MAISDLRECSRCGGTMYDTLEGIYQCQDCPHTEPTAPEHDDEPLPAACMNGTCTCPSTPDGADQHHVGNAAPGSTATT